MGLTIKKIKSAKPNGKPYKLRDGGGLWFTHHTVGCKAVACGIIRKVCGTQVGTGVFVVIGASSAEVRTLPPF